jgi:hypothetical protein
VTRAVVGGAAAGQRGHDVAVQGVMGRLAVTCAGSDAGEGDDSALVVAYGCCMGRSCRAEGA